MKRENYLEKILVHKRLEVDRLIKKTENNPKHELNQVLARSHALSQHFSLALKKNKLSVIGEVKRRSPSLGDIREIEDPVELGLKYCQGGASAISVLTDTIGFGGSLADLKQVADALKIKFSEVSILRKDFIIHRLQLAEAVIAGAHAVLLIANVVGENLKGLLIEAKRLGLETLTEVHDRAELELALNAEAPIIGINHRNLSTFEIDLGISESLRNLIPSHVITVAESGIHNEDSARRMRDLGYDAILVGEALVRSNDPVDLIKRMQR